MLAEKGEGVEHRHGGAVEREEKHRRRQMGNAGID
jgi:hypothetical protein